MEEGVYSFSSLSRSADARDSNKILALMAYWYGYACHQLSIDESACRSRFSPPFRKLPVDACAATINKRVGRSVPARQGVKHCCQDSAAGGSRGQQHDEAWRGASPGWQAWLREVGSVNRDNAPQRTRLKGLRAPPPPVKYP